jgi:outer membrane lipoprotein-sorting protein
MRLQRRSVAIIACVCALGFVDAAQRDLFDEIYARGKPIESDLKTLTAQFVETSTSTLLAKPLVARGTLAVIRPSRVALRYTAPEARTVLIDGEVMRVIWPARALDQKTGIGAAQRRIQQYFVAKSPSQLRSHFEIVAREAIERPGTWLVSMTPKRKQIRAGLTKLDLWIEQKAVLLNAMQLTFPNGDTKLMEFSDVVLNPAIDASMFTP